MGSYRIYVENNLGLNRDCSMWTPFGHLKSGDKGSGAHLHLDASTSAFCPLEKRALPHNKTPHDQESNKNKFGNYDSLQNRKMLTKS